MRNGSPLLVAVALMASSCSGDGASPESTDAETTTSSTPTSTTTTTLVPPQPTDPPELIGPTIGELEVPCGETDEVDISDQIGIGEGEIVIATANDRGGLATVGAARGGAEMMSALASFCNGFGGLSGRDVVVISYDAAVVETTARISEACDETLALVGHRLLRADEAAAAATECGLGQFEAGAGFNDRSPLPLHAHLVALFAAPKEAGMVVLVGPDTLSAVDARVDRRTALARSPVPISVAGEITYPVDENPDWSRIVGQARATGAGLVHLTGGCANAVVPFLTVASAAGWSPFVVATAAAYDSVCLDAGLDLDRLLIELPFLPYEDGEDAAATAAHADVLDAIGAPHTGEALLAASAFWRWAVAVEECGPSLDRECLLTADLDRDGWTAGGLHPAVGSGGTTEACVVVMGVQDGSFVRLLPVEVGTYDCTPEWSVRP